LSGRCRVLASPDTALSGLLESLLAEVGVSPKPAVLNEAPPRPLEIPTAAAPAATAGAQQPGVPPDWARAPFKALLVDLGGLRLAVPLVFLHSVAAGAQPLTPLPGQPPWHLGVVQYRDRRLTVVDLARLLELRTPAAVPGQGYLLVIGAGDVALWCAELAEPVRLQPETLRWRRPGDGRPWLASLLPEQMCALLDVEGILHLIRHE